MLWTNILMLWTNICFIGDVNDVKQREMKLNSNQTVGSLRDKYEVIVLIYTNDQISMVWEEVFVLIYTNDEI